jgi:molybdenum cofactor guanylyltransferase
MSEGKLPVHGFVLAGGKSSRMGVDKASLAFRGRPMVEIAVEKLRGFCAEVGICGNREDLAAFAEVVREERVDAGPAAGIEAGLKAARQEWVMFVPVDVPLVPGELLRRWAEMVIGSETEPDTAFLGKLMGSYLYTKALRQPTFCMLRRNVLPVVSEAMDGGDRRVERIHTAIGAEFGVASMMTLDAATFAVKGEATDVEMEYWFSNVNTPQELDEAEAWAGIVEGGEADPLRG